MNRTALERAGLVWAPEVRGSLCHQLIAMLCERGVFELHEIERYARAVLPSGLAPVYRQALLSFLVPMAGRYLACFRDLGWRFAGSEVIIDDVALDLLWEQAGCLRADEVKSCVSAAIGWRERAECQARAQASAGEARYGAAFEGVRVVTLAIPDAAFWVRA